PSESWMASILTTPSSNLFLTSVGLPISRMLQTSFSKKFGSPPFSIIVNSCPSNTFVSSCISYPPPCCAAHPLIKVRTSWHFWRLLQLSISLDRSWPATLSLNTHYWV